VHGPGMEALSLSSASWKVRGPVVNTTPDGLRWVDKLHTAFRIASVSYCCGPGCSSHFILPLLDAGLLADDGRPKVTDWEVLFLVKRMPFRIASGSYV